MSSCGWFPLRPDEIREWIATHPESLPNSLADLARYPMAFRRIMVGLVSPEVRVRLWREHLEVLLEPQSWLNPTQRVLVTETIPQLPALLAAPAPNPVMTDWETRMATAFTGQEAGRVFMLIGPPEPPEGIPLPPDAHPTSSP